MISSDITGNAEFSMSWIHEDRTYTIFKNKKNYMFLMSVFGRTLVAGYDLAQSVVMAEDIMERHTKYIKELESFKGFLDYKITSQE